MVESIIQKIFVSLNVNNGSQEILVREQNVNYGRQTKFYNMNHCSGNMTNKCNFHKIKT